ncbi:MAG TPA: DUF3147 family protein [Candidatus Acidoferrales bacterium]|nr:DUF3147 family protein [Candidatus Acidoferrales bacterium]
MLYFWLEILLAFIVGGLWVSMSTIAADAFGSKVGGLLAGLPSMIFVALFFIGISEGTSSAVKVASAFPMAYGITVLFLLIYTALARHGYLKAILPAFAVWFALSSIILALNLDNAIYSLTVYAIIFLFSYFAMTKLLKVPSLGKARVKASTLQKILRGVMGGAVVAFVVFIAKTSGPVYGGVFGALPIVFSSVLTISYSSRGVEFSRAIAKSLALTGVTTTVYIVAVILSYPTYGVVFGTIISYAIALASATLIYKYMKAV